MNNEAFYTIFRWMHSELLLNDKEEKIYAIIYSFSNTGENTCNAAVSTLAELGNMSASSVKRALKNLEKKGMIKKITRIYNNQKMCEYMAINVSEKRKQGRKLAALLAVEKEKGKNKTLTEEIEKYKF